MAMDTERAVCEKTHQHCLLEESWLSHLQEQLDLAEEQAQDALKEVRLAVLSNMYLGIFPISVLFVCLLR